MKRIAILMAGAAFVVAGSSAALAGGYSHGSTQQSQASMKQMGDIVDNAAASADHTTLVAAVKAAGLVETLKSKGPFTVFAPTNDAFNDLPEGTLATLLKPENKAKLSGILTYHVVAGELDAKAVASAIEAGNGSATLTTVQGETLTASIDPEGGVLLTDATGASSRIIAADMRGSNGIIHVVNTVLLPS